MALESSSSSSSDTVLAPGFSCDQIQTLLMREDQYLCVDYTSTSFQQQQQARDGHDMVMDTSATSIATMHKVQSTCSLRDVQAERRSSATTAIGTTTTIATTPLQHELNGWRPQMFDWAVMVVDSIGADRESVACCFALLDRFLVTELRRTKAPPISRDDYQLFCMTCLYIATKILDPYPHKLAVQTLVDMSKQYYTIAIIEQTEIDILTALNWRIHSPTALTYARLYSDLLQQHQQQHHRAESSSGAPPSTLSLANLTMVTEIAVSSGQFVSCRPSVVGLAAVLLAVDGSNAMPELLQDFLQQRADVLPRDGDEFRHVYTLLEKLCS